MVSIKSKGGDCWHYDTGVVLDGNSLTGQLKFDKRHWYKRTRSWNKGLLIKIKKLKEKDDLR